MSASRLVIEGCAVATVDPDGSEYASGHLVVERNRIAVVGNGPAPDVELLLVGGRLVVESAELRTADEREVAREIAGASRRLAEKMEVGS